MQEEIVIPDETFKIHSLSTAATLCCVGLDPEPGFTKPGKNYGCITDASASRHVLKDVCTAVQKFITDACQVDPGLDALDQ